jgi:hypothetical protein
MAKEKKQTGRKKYRGLQKAAVAEALAAAQEAAWRGSFHALVVFQRQHGHCDVPVEAKMFRALSAWLATQREQQARGLLAESRRRELEALGVDFTPVEEDGDGRTGLDRSRDEQWDERYEELVAFHRRFGHTRVTKTWRENPGLGHWRHFQRVLHREGKMDPERRARLDALGFEWQESGRVSADMSEQWQHQWERQFVRLQQFKAEHGHVIVPRGWPPDPQLAKWVHRQRELSRKGQLAGDRIARLDELGFEWGTRILHFEDAWEVRFRELQEFHRAFGHTRVTKRWKKHPGLGHWRHFQRVLHREGKMDPERRARLDALGFEWAEPDRFGQTRIEQWQNLWEQRYAELCRFQQAHGHCEPGVDDGKNRQLAKWVRRQRVKYHARQQPPDYIRRLEALGFQWRSEFRNNAHRWEQRFQQLAAFHRTFGHSRVTKAWKEHPGLYSWRHHQRELYRAGLLPPARKARLDGLGFDWEEPEGVSLGLRDTVEAQWFEMLERLADFHEEHGHSKVPKRWPADQALANWAAKQRAKMSKGTLSRHLVRELKVLKFPA